MINNLPLSDTPFLTLTQEFTSLHFTFGDDDVQPTML